MNQCTQIPKTLKEIKITLPDYKNSNCNLSNSILKNFGIKPLNDTLSLIDPYLEKDYKNVVLLLLDGMGKTIVENHLKEEGAFRTHLAGIYKSVFLPTTVAATTSIRSGLMPIEHSWFGCECYYPSIDKNVVVFTNKIQGIDTQAAPYNVAQTVNPYESIIDKINKTENEAYEVASYYDKEVTSIEKLCEKVKTICSKPLKNNNAKRFIYAYFEDPDHALHLNGCKSERVTNILTNIEKVVENLTKELNDTLFIITADHGHIDTDIVMLQDYPKIMNTLVRLPSLEPRALNLFVKEGLEEIFEEEFNKEFGDKFLLLTMQEVLEKGLFGTKPPHKNAKGMLGNYMAIATSNLTIITINFVDEFFVSMHGGLTEDEMLIPLIIFD